ncbi:hypothetical protein ACL03H_13215 [Saccharopolyspora sp. MS10]
MSGQRDADGDGPGAVFVGPGRMLCNADSAEAALAMFSIIREVRLVWL